MCTSMWLYISENALIFQMNCYEYSKLDTHRFGRAYNEGEKPKLQLHTHTLLTTRFLIPLY